MDDTTQCDILPLYKNVRTLPKHIPRKKNCQLNSKPRMARNFGTCISEVVTAPIAHLLKCASSDVINSKRKKITPRNLARAIRDDEFLFHMFGNVCIADMPHLQDNRNMYTEIRNRHMDKSVYNKRANKRKHKKNENKKHIHKKNE